MKKVKTNKDKKKDSGGQLYFAQVKPETFRRILKAKYYGESPFNKSQSYAAFATRENEKHWNGQALFPEMRFSYYLLSYSAKRLGIKPTEHDRIIAYRLFKGIQNEAESVKCEHCCGHGYVSKTIAYGSKAYKA